MFSYYVNALNLSFLLEHVLRCRHFAHFKNMCCILNDVLRKVFLSQKNITTSDFFGLLSYQAFI